MTEFALMDKLLSEDREQFGIHDDASAEWAAQRIREKEAERDRLVKASRAFIQHYERQIEDAESTCASETGFLLSCLERYFDTVPHKAGKTQETYRLPSFKLKLKHQAPKPVRNDAILLQWATQEDPVSYVRTKAEPNWEAIKADCVVDGDTLVLADTGEIVPGVTLMPRLPVFTIENV